MNIEPLLAVTRRLAAPVDLMTMLEEVVAAATQVLDAERASVWLYEPGPHELVLQVSLDLKKVRVPADAGIVGACARERRIINVPDCYADPRFNREMDRHTHFHTRSLLALPLVDQKDVLVGVLQVLNKKGGPFAAADEAMAESLAAQCAVALQRAQMTQALIEGEKMRRELEMAREVQRSTLPAAMPEVRGYEVYGLSIPADLTGGDTFDVARVPAGLFLVLGDATGHGLAPALHVTQMHAMLRMALRLGAGLDESVLHLNNQLAAQLPEDRFITAFIGLLDLASHTLRYHSAGQAPILHFSAAQGRCAVFGPTTFPLAAMPAAQAQPARVLELAPGDGLVLLSDGIYEYANAAGEMFGEGRVQSVVEEHRFAAPQVLCGELMSALRSFAGGAPQEDDITILLLRRDLPRASRSFARTFDSLASIFEFRAAAFREQGIDASLAGAVDFTLEELFTNMVKYGGGESPVEIEITGSRPAVQVTLVDPGVDRFDITRAPDADVQRPIEDRQPGGLGLHLVRRMVDSIEYGYDAAARTGRTRFHKKVSAPAPPEGS
jgi:phosphoserine phosphatase